MDDEQARAIGRRVRYWRERRNFGRKHFADLVGRSTSWLDKIEKGERNLLRLPMLERVAEVLSIDPTTLTDEPTAQRVAQCVDAGEVQAIRAALGSYPGLGPARADQALTVRQLGQQAEYLDLAWTSSHFTVVAQHLPTLIRDAQTAGLVASAADQLAARRIMVTTYRLASSMLLKFEANHIAWLAADRAMHAALSTDDTWSLARATRSVARAMTSSGQKPEAIDTLLSMTDRMRPEVTTNGHHLLALYGMLFLAASITAAEEDDADLAHQMYLEARTAAEQLQPLYRTYNTFFGSTNVAIHRVAALVRLHEGGRALELARTIDPGKIATLSPERKANYLLDLTEAQASVGRHRQAVQMLDQAEQIAPEEVRCRPLAHGLLRLLLNSTAGEPARQVRQMAERAGVTA
jgi:transcriptional regulator with XRE-family HTH domain